MSYSTFEISTFDVKKLPTARRIELYDKNIPYDSIARLLGSKKRILVVGGSYYDNSGTLYKAIEAFFESSDYESCVRKAVSIGGDSDTIAAIAGGIAEAFYGTIPDDIRKKGRLILDSGLKRVLDEFEAKYCKG